MNIFENFFGNAPDNGADPARSVLRLALRSLVGGYIVYTGLKLITAGGSDAIKPVPEWIRPVIGAMFAAAGAAFIGYSLYAFYKAYKASKLLRTEEKEALKENADSTEAAVHDITAPESEQLLSGEKYTAVCEIYRQYFEAVEKTETRSRPTDGLMGFGSSPKNAPCHEDFYNALSDKLDEYLAGGLSEPEAFIIAGYILRAPAEYRNNSSVFPMLFAATGLVKKLADKLSSRDADILAIEYSENIPRLERMPAQEKMLRSLYDRARV